MLCEVTESCFKLYPDKRVIFRKSMEKFKVKRKTEIPQYLEIAGASNLHKEPPRFTWPFIKILVGLFDTTSLQQRFLREEFALQGARTVDSFSGLPDYSGLRLSALLATAGKNEFEKRFQIKKVLMFLVAMKRNWESISGTIFHSVLRRMAGEQWDRVFFRKKPPIPNAILVKGVLDEYGVLQERQVYVRHLGTTYVGPILIYRSPINLPGDVQRVMAISDAELDQQAGERRLEANALRCLDEIVAFAKQGSRPLPNMLSGTYSFAEKCGKMG